ncbi:murein L,D-transpeptidase [Taibaiella lutea]|uniref:Murein L,D-transpeptidase n=1 Tax=Taibaiella lutea TaxID=2608001 RepID=A0A5M6CH10_9BACT|nr:L,D-transpeptidase [Taibaiella lutea]KAA5534481.1 murein L,D-transpeptidase [Taibaiella lutea]
MTLSNYFKYLLLLFIFIIPFTASSQTNVPTKAPEPEKKNFKVISETKDKYGNIVRKVQYSQGATTVTETLILPPFPALGERIKVNPDTLNHDSIMVFVDKTNYLIAILYKRKRIRQYRAVFGPDRLKDKMMEGDRCTPEGWFKIVSKKEHGNWQKFLLLDYPNQASYTKFNERKQEGTIPQGAQIGGAVGIHGTFLSGVKMVDWGVGWTDGCIALKPEDINDLYQFVFPGTRVFVRK